jgi:serine/threonine protein kinase
MRKISKYAGPKGSRLTPTWKDDLNVASLITSTFVHRMYDAFETKDRVSLLMEYCAEGTVRQYMESLKSKGEVCSEQASLFLGSLFL